jgi:gliding motility-associated-like protein
VDVTAVTSDAPDCVSGAVNVQLIATLFPIDNGSYQYQWTGPGGYESTDPTAIISGATNNDSGPYVLVVTNDKGCESEPATVNVEIPSVLSTPVIESITPACVGDDIELKVAPFNNGNVSYVWTTPNTTVTTSTPELSLDDIAMSDAGSYSVNYLVDGCSSPLSASVELEINAIPTISPSSNSPVCEGDVIEFNVGCSAGASYEWFGPGSFGSAICNPIIVDADASLHTGAYSIRKQVDGCWSEVETINVIVKEKPALPSVSNAGPYCADTEDVVLSVTAGTGTSGATYTWYDASDNTQVGNSTPALNLPVPNASDYGDGNFQFYVIADLDGCKSDPSFETEVSINTIPANVAEAGPHVDACDGDEIFLNGTQPSVGTGFWTAASSNPPGVTIFNPDEADTEIEGLMVGETYTFEWTLSNGACADYSSDETTVFVNMLEEADAGDRINVCETSIVMLDGNVPQSNDGQWTQPSAQEMLGITIVDPSNPNTSVTGLEPDNEYIFTWTIDGGCGSSSDDVIVDVDVVVNAYGGMDFEDCGDGSTVMDATPAESGEGAWSSPDAAIEFTSVTDPLTTALNLSEGMNTMIWTVDSEACGETTDTVFVDYQMAPIAFDDRDNPVAFAGNTVEKVTANDMFLTDFFNIEIVNGPFHGKATVENDGTLTYQAEVNFIGTDSLEYEVCVENCECSRATVEFTVGDGAGCFAPSIITPNGDGMNDAFVIPCLAEVDNDGQSAYPSNSISIFNQWGDEVYNAKPYANNWRGTFDGEDLPAGTYFYIINLGNGDEPMSGYLIVQR